MEKENQKQVTKEYALESIITTSAKLPAVKVNRNSFLEETFKNEKVPIQDVLDLGPVEAGVSREDLFQIATKLILKRTSVSSIASFTAGLPGGAAMAATVPLDITQFFGMSIRLAQELSYLYGAEDLWKNGSVDEEKIRNQLIMYCGVMFGVSGAVSGVRVLTTQLVKATAKRLPQKALMKTFWFPILKKIGKALCVKVTKETVTKGVTKALPIFGGIISGAMNFASMMPMANRLLKTLDKACFDYSEAEFDSDIEKIENITDEIEIEVDKKDFNIAGIKEKVASEVKNAGTSISGAFSKFKGAVSPKKSENNANNSDDKFEAVKKYKELLDMGIISQEEFDLKKAELLNL